MPRLRSRCVRAPGCNLQRGSSAALSSPCASCLSGAPTPPLLAPSAGPQADGSVVIPEVLRPFMMGIDVIRPKKKVEA